MLKRRAVWNRRSRTWPKEMSFSGFSKIGSQTVRIAASKSLTFFDEGLEALLDDDFRQHRIAGLLQAEDQVLADRRRVEEGGLPEALFHAVAVQQHQLRYAHRGDGLQHPAEHLRSRQGQ
ncbi:hypothetical protein G039_0324250 [Pseudomonas aeruginosa VRFPA01]|nr:hypothetical protein G039_0324250 [Pseudomonas aeruginosa VRFPA01]